MNDALIKFQKTVCPEISMDDPRIIEKLIEEITKLKSELGG